MENNEKRASSYKKGVELREPGAARYERFEYSGATASVHRLENADTIEAEAPTRRRNVFSIGKH
jgi:hypothetical protein